jgi:hypothetical protein
VISVYFNGQKRVHTYSFIAISLRLAGISLGVSYISTRTVFQILHEDQGKIGTTILMAWSIWLTRNDRIFNNLDPSVEGCRRKFKKEFALLLHRAKPSLLSDNWVHEFQP